MKSCIEYLKSKYVNKKLMALEYGANGPDSKRSFQVGAIIEDVTIGNNEIVIYFRNYSQFGGRDYVKVHPNEIIVVSE